MDKQLTHDESLAIISGMIQQAKSNVAGSSFFILLWGWVALIGYLGHYTLFQIGFDSPYLVWLITFPAAIASMVRGYQLRNEAKVKTYTDQLYGNVWGALIIPFISVISFGGQLNYENITGLILLMVGTGLFISSKLLKFAPATYGAFIIWAGAIAALVFNDETQFLIGAMATVLGYLVPGYMLKQKEKNG